MPKNSNTDPKPQCVQTDVMQSAMATDYRIGNIIQYNNEIESTGTITALIADFVAGLDYCQIDYRTNKKHWLINIKPIEITEEWLMKIGYEKMPSGTYLQPNSGNFIWFEKGLKCCIAGEYYPENIKYIHQLQNLHFALTQRELVVA